MARNLDTYALACAQNQFRNDLRALEADFTSTPKRVLCVCALLDLADAALAADPTIYLMERSVAHVRAFENAGHSPMLGALAHEVRRRMHTTDEGVLTLGIVDDVVAVLIATPEFKRVQHDRENPVPACCDWTVPASN